MQLETAARLVKPAQPGRGAGLARAGQGEGEQRVAGRGAGFAMAAGGAPGWDQLVDIPRRDLVERREAAATLIVAIIFGGTGSGGR